MRLGARGPTAAGSMVLWGFGGAAVVMAFWMAIGLLSFAGPRSEVAPLRDAQSVESAGCTALTLDRHLGRTTAGPCESPASSREAVAARLADLSRP